MPGISGCRSLSDLRDAAGLVRTVWVMSSRRRDVVRTWAGPIDLTRSEVFAILPDGEREIGGFSQLVRLERRYGRLFLRVFLDGEEMVTVSRHASNRSVAVVGDMDELYGTEVGHALRALYRAGAREYSLKRLGLAMVSCGRVDLAVLGVSRACMLVGGGASRWAEDLRRQVLDDPAPLDRLALLVSDDGQVLGGVKPWDLASALGLARLVRDARRDALSAGSQSTSIEPPLSEREIAPFFSGFELVLAPASSTAVPEVLRRASAFAPVWMSDAGEVVLRLPDVRDLSRVVSLLARQMRSLLAQGWLTDSGLVGVGLHGVGLRFVWPLELGQLPAVSADLLRLPRDPSFADASEALRRSAEDRDVAPASLAAQFVAHGRAVSTMSSNEMLRMVRMVESGVAPGSLEWEALLSQAATEYSGVPA